MLPKAHLTSHSRISGCREVITPSWLSGSSRPFLYSSSVCISLRGWATHSCCSSHLYHFWRWVPAICQRKESEAPCCNNLLPLWEAHLLPGLPQLCHTSLLRISSEQSTLMFFLEAWAPSPHSQQWAWLQATSQLGSAVWQWTLWWILSVLPLTTCCFVPLWGSKTPLCPHPWGVSEHVGTFPPSLSLPRVLVPVPKSFFLFFKSLSFAYLILRRLACLFGSQGSPASIQNVFCMSWSTYRCIFWCICGEEVDLPVLFFHHLESPPTS